MDRAIFELKASVDATSLYILICALLDQGVVMVTAGRALNQWSGTRESLFSATEELMNRKVLERMQPLSDETHLHVNSKEKWQ
jgi:hypothetical protein